jgi:hypothetical protein
MLLFSGTKVTTGDVKVILPLVQELITTVKTDFVSASE